MDRGFLESNPFSIIEGMITGGYAVGADRGFIYVRQEYPLATERVAAALEQAREAGFLGENILSSGFSFELELVRGAGAFVSGEETALIASIEGRRAFPRQRPPFPVVRTALRLGATRATIYYRRSKAEMPARVEEVKHAEAEGIFFNFLTVPVRFLGNSRGKLEGTVLQKLALGAPDSSGRPRPVPVPVSEFEVEVDLAVVAVGQSPNPLLIKQLTGLKIGGWGNVEADFQTMATSLPGIHAGGDVVRGGATVILAMGDGRRAARAIDEFLRKE